jgi:hypothetical protein
MHTTLGFNAVHRYGETAAHSLWELPSCLAHAHALEPPQLFGALSPNVARTGDTTVGDSSSHVATLLSMDKRLYIQRSFE